MQKKIGMWNNKMQLSIKILQKKKKEKKELIWNKTKKKKTFQKQCGRKQLKAKLFNIQATKLEKNGNFPNR